MKQNFKSINNMLQNIIKKYNLEDSFNIESIKSNWETIVNKNIYKLAKPVKIEKQVLYLQVKTNYWKLEFELAKDQIIEMINSNIYPFKIKEIKFI